MSTCTEAIPIVDPNVFARNDRIIGLLRGASDGGDVEWEPNDTTKAGTSTYSGDEQNQSLPSIFQPRKDPAEPLVAQLWYSCLLAQRKLHTSRLADAYVRMLINEFQNPGETPSAFTAEWADVFQSASGATPHLPLRTYLSGLVERSVVAHEAARVSLELWDRLQVACNDRLPEPDAAPVGQDAVMLALDSASWHMEFETFSAEHTEVFLLNRGSDETWEAELSICEEFPEALLTRLELFFE